MWFQPANQNARKISTSLFHPSLSRDFKEIKSKGNETGLPSKMFQALFILFMVYCIPYMEVNVDFLPYMEVNVGKKKKKAKHGEMRWTPNFGKYFQIFDLSQY